MSENCCSCDRVFSFLLYLPSSTFPIRAWCIAFISRRPSPNLPIFVPSTPTPLTRSARHHCFACHMTVVLVITGLVRAAFMDCSHLGVRWSNIQSRISTSNFSPASGHSVVQSSHVRTGTVAYPNHHQPSSSGPRKHLLYITNHSNFDLKLMFEIKNSSWEVVWGLLF